MEYASKLEAKFAAALEARQIPFETQFKFDERRKWRADFFIPQRLIVECEGLVWRRRKLKGVAAAVGLEAPEIRKQAQGAHDNPVGICRDIERHNAAVMAGFKVLRCTNRGSGATSVEAVADLVESMWRKGQTC